MLSLGLTGGIASGKSLAAGFFSRKGAHVLDADTIAREAVLAGRPGLRQIIEAFGAAILTAAGELDRERLGGIVFSDPGKRKILDAILHPLIIGSMFEKAEQMEKSGYAGILVCDIPLLFECGLQGRFDKTVLVYTDPAVQVKRLHQRNGIPIEQALQRLNSQMPIDAKRQLADFVIENTGTVAELEAGVSRVWAAIGGNNACKNKTA